MRTACPVPRAPGSARPAPPRMWSTRLRRSGSRSTSAGWRRAGSSARARARPRSAPCCRASSTSVPVGVHEPDGAGVRPERRDGLVEQHGERPLAGDLPRERRGQRLEARGERQGPVAVGDVAGDHRRAVGHAVGVAERRDRERDDDLAPVLGQALGLVVLDPLAGEHLVEDPPLLAAALRRESESRSAARPPRPRCSRTSVARPGFQLVITPSRSLLRIASSDEATIAANRSRELSAAASSDPPGRA